MTRTRLLVATCILGGMASAVDAQGVDSTTVDLPPAGYGSLRQDEVAVNLRVANVQIRLLPLDQRVIRLLAPDTYRAMANLLDARDDALRRSIGAWSEPNVFLVTLFGLENGAPFTPDDLVLVAQNRTFQPIAILPLTPRWGEHRLELREPLSALYVFENQLDVLEVFTAHYAGMVATGWEASLRRLEIERARVMGQIRSQAPTTGGRVPNSPASSVFARLEHALTSVTHHLASFGYH